MKNLILYATAIMLVAITACSKDDDKTDNTNNTNNTPQTNDYSYPTTAGISWTYSSNMVPGGSFTVTSTNRDTTISGKTYHIYTNDADGLDDSYFSNYQGTVLQYMNASQMSYGQDVELPIISNVEQGETWDKTITVSQTTGGYTYNYQMVYHYTMAEKGVSKTVEAGTFDDCIKITVDASMVFEGNEQQMSTGDEYVYAKGVGLIYHMVQGYTSELTSYSFQ